MVDEYVFEVVVVYFFVVGFVEVGWCEGDWDVYVFCDVVLLVEFVVVVVVVVFLDVFELVVLDVYFCEIFWEDFDVVVYELDLFGVEFVGGVYVFVEVV